MAIQSKEVLTKDGKQYHIHCKKGEVGKYVLLPGDLKRLCLNISLFV